MKIVINQIDITDYQVSVNAALILKSINEHKDCQGFMLFPELAFTGFPTADNIDSLCSQSQSHFEDLLIASKNTDSTIIVGHIDKQDQLFYNACYFIKNGKIIHKHRKSKLWLDDVGVFTSGKDLSVVSINDVVCGAQICFELEFPEGSRALAKKRRKNHIYAKRQYVSLCKYPLCIDSSSCYREPMFCDYLQRCGRRSWR
ncbi:carbon-nitrogen hydrolase family protein [Psychrobacter fozii]|uniref:carbon-nitrogen hydrolase family protein n=1 Tax=Psychrobacter fozii TaxID=198480 RepID=UPI0019186248|nr:carbon-nitrogen hydrolase family protein [Psychrobacter fozii]